MENCTEYKKSKTADERRRLTEELLRQHPDKVPIIFEPDKSLLKNGDGKFKVTKMISPKIYHVTRIKQMLQSKLNLAQDETLFIFKDKKSIQPCRLILPSEDHR